MPMPARWRRPRLAGRHVALTLCVQHEDELLDAVVGRRRLRLLHAIVPKPTLFQDADRANVVHRDMGVQRPDRHTFVIFPGRVFRYPRGDHAARTEAEAFAVTLGIPAPQLDW